MEMSKITLRIEWKHLQIPAGPASCRNCPLKNRNLGFGRDGTFFSEFEEMWKMGGAKKMLPIQKISQRIIEKQRNIEEKKTVLFI